MTEGNLIELRGIRLSRRGRPLFDGLDFAMKEGDRVGLVGPNGSGKTTLMHLIMGLLKPSSGEIRVFGKPRSTEEDFAEVRRRVGLLFQDSDDQLFCPTVREDVAFGPLNLGRTHEEAEAIVEETLAALGIEGLAGEVTHHLSGGEKRLVALATVAAMRPECYLLDEPTDGLDEGHAGLFLEYLRRECRTYLVASHDRDFLGAAVDRAFMLRDGALSPVSL
jgi:cobalt/nickel transport system ATP-binding protein